jgi:hypothetical protein
MSFRTAFRLVIVGGFLCALAGVWFASGAAAGL